jgi:hypothetical protein
MRLFWIGLVTWWLATPALADVSVAVTTGPVPAPNNTYAPRNIVAVWVEGAGGAFVKTIDRWAGVRKDHLVAWTAKAGAADADAVSGATRLSDTTPLNITWNLRDRTGALIPDGTYTIRMELAESNATLPAQNNQGTFTFVKGASPQNQTGLSNGGFTNVSINYTPPITTCNNGVVDSGETCDPSVAGSCPTSCAVSADACMPNALVGAAASCDARCAITPITACAGGDGCCPEGCEDTDPDCGAASVTGGCATTGSARGAIAVGLAAWAMLVAAARRRRRR